MTGMMLLMVRKSKAMMSKLRSVVSVTTREVAKGWLSPARFLVLSEVVLVDCESPKYLVFEVLLRIRLPQWLRECLEGYLIAGELIVVS
jgi:hypothetical protein